MRPSLIVKLEVVTDPCLGLARGLIGMQIDMLVFHGFPETFHEHVVSPGPLAIHTDANVVVLEIVREDETRELTALIGVHDLL